MPPKLKPGNFTTNAAALKQRAQDAAETADRWFVSLAYGIEDVGTWAKGEAHIVADSFKAALDTTLDVTKKIVGPAAFGKAAEDREPEPHEPTAGATVSPLASEAEFSRDNDGRLHEARTAQNPGNLDLLWATDDLSDDSRSCVDERSCVDQSDSQDGSRGGYLPGVLPLVQALERIIGEHAYSGHRSLEKDSRFWRLVQLLYLFRPPHAEGDGVGDSSTGAQDLSLEPAMETQAATRR